MLGQYDLVFAKGRCALEAMAVGAAVVLFGSHGAGPLVSRQNFDRLRQQNFGVRAQQLPATSEALLRQIDGYSAVDARAVSAKVRAEAGLEAAVDRLVEIYRRAIAAQREAAPDAASEARSAAAYLRQIGPIFHALPQVSHEAQQLRREAEQLRRDAAQLAAQRDQLQGELARIRSLWPVRLSAPLRRVVRALRGGKKAA
jgi:chromosome segregation ATPase